MVAAYLTLSYAMKAAMVYSLAWKAATGVAAAEGLAIGGWGCSNVRKQKAVAAASAADLARLQSEAARELAALRGLLQQREAQHGQEVTSLSTLNERLNRLAQDLRAENSNLQGALERAAAERKSLEAAAALQAAHAQSGALVEVAAAHSGRVVDEVAGLALGQQQLVALALIAAGVHRPSAADSSYLTSFLAG
ncbi:hypothetical protein OEZ86_002895 [Tetradesmus obliquus]|nr:hypothetical protein OEZ86_002895 [Tetradesmus obliquus]